MIVLCDMLLAIFVTPIETLTMAKDSKIWYNMKNMRTIHLLRIKIKIQVTHKKYILFDVMYLKFEKEHDGTLLKLAKQLVLVLLSSRLLSW